jgi:hypothetical protein
MINTYSFSYETVFKQLLYSREKQANNDKKVKKKKY